MTGSIPNRQHAVKTSAQALRELVVQVFRLNGALTAAGDALAGPAGQTSARWRVLAAVEDEPRTVAQIARAWSLARQSVQRVADVLERDGLVSYEPNPAHRRASLLTLTPPGREALTRIQAAQRAWAEDVSAQVGAQDLQRASAILGRVLEAIQAQLT